MNADWIMPSLPGPGRPFADLRIENCQLGLHSRESCYTTIHFNLSFCGTLCILNIVKQFVCKRRKSLIVISLSVRLPTCWGFQYKKSVCTVWSCDFLCHMMIVHVMVVHLRPTRALNFKHTMIIVSNIEKQFIDWKEDGAQCYFKAQDKALICRLFDFPDFF